MATARNTLEGGSNGTTITTGNSGGTSGNAFDLVSIGVGATCKYSTAHSRNSLSCEVATPASGTATFVEYSTTIGTVTTLFVTIYLYLLANPAGANLRLIRWLNGATEEASVIVNTSGQLQLRDSAGAISGNTTAAITLNQWVRIEAKIVCSTTVGVVEASIYNTADSTTATETITKTARNTGTQITKTDLGECSAPGAITARTFYIDDIRFSTAAYPGPTTLILTQPVETDHPIALDGTQFRPAVKRTYTTTQPSETDAPQSPASPKRTYTLGQPSTASTANAMSVTKTKAITQPTEGDHPIAIDGNLYRPVPTRTYPITQPSTSAVANAMTVKKTLVLGQPTTTAIAQAMSRSKTKTIGQPSETDHPNPGDLIPAWRMLVRKTWPIGQAEETDAGRNMIVTHPAPPPPPPTVSGVQQPLYYPEGPGELYVRVTGPDGTQDFPELAEMQGEETAPGGMQTLTGVISRERFEDLRAIYQEAAIVEVFHAQGDQRFYGWLQTPAPDETKTVTLKVDGVGKDMDRLMRRLMYSSADPRLWVDQHSEGFHDGHGYFVQGQAAVTLDQAGHLQWQIPKGASVHDTDQAGYIAWVPNGGDAWRRFAAHLEVSPSDPSYVLRFETAIGPEGDLRVGEAQTVALPSGGDTESDIEVFFTRQTDDLLNVNLYRVGDDSSTDDAVLVTLTMLEAQMIASGDMSVSDVVRDVAGRLGWGTGPIMNHGQSGLPLDVQQGGGGAACDLMSLLVDWRWLGTASGGGPEMDFGPWSRRRWWVVDPEFPVRPVALERYDSIVVPFRYAHGMPSTVEVFLPGKRLRRSRSFGEISLDGPQPTQDIAVALGQSMLASLYEQRWAGECEFTEVMDSNGQRWPGHVVKAGDELVTEQCGLNRVAGLSWEQSTSGASIKATFDERHAVLDHMIARRSQRVQAQGIA